MSDVTIKVLAEDTTEEEVLDTLYCHSSILVNTPSVLADLCRGLWEDGPNEKRQKQDIVIPIKCARGDEGHVRTMVMSMYTGKNENPKVELFDEDHNDVDEVDFSRTVELMEVCNKYRATWLLYECMRQLMDVQVDKWTHRCIEWVMDLPTEVPCFRALQMAVAAMWRNTIEFVDEYTHKLLMRAPFHVIEDLVMNTPKSDMCHIDEQLLIIVENWLGLGGGFSGSPWSHIKDTRGAKCTLEEKRVLCMWLEDGDKDEDVHVHMKDFVYNHPNIISRWGKRPFPRAEQVCDEKRLFWPEIAFSSVAPESVRTRKFLAFGDYVRFEYTRTETGHKITRIERNWACEDIVLCVSCLDGDDSELVKGGPLQICTPIKVVGWKKA